MPDESAPRPQVDRTPGAGPLERYQAMADALLDAYRTGTPQAMERHYRWTWHRRVWATMRTYVQLELGRRPANQDDEVDITIDDARLLVAREHGYDSWQVLRDAVASLPADVPFMAKPMRVRSRAPSPDVRPGARTRDWPTVLDLLRATPSPALDGEGQMTDAMLHEVAAIEGLSALHLAGSKAVTDEGIRHLARLPGLQHLDLTGTGVTDRGLEVLRELPALEVVSLAMTRVTDAGVAHLAACDDLRQVDLAGTATGDGAIRSLAGRRHLARFASGNAVTDGGLAALHGWPVFTHWQGGAPSMALTSHQAGPNQLSLRGTLTDRGMQHLRGLEGLFALDIDDRGLSITADALVPLISLPHLGWLAADARDDWMPHIAAMPRLRFLSAQDTVASDAGFVALARSTSIEYIWGRRCHNLTRRGFVALADMPALRGLSVSCLSVDDAGLSALPRFPALTELMPMDIPDDGYRHVGRCLALESLILMYCRDTTDAATAQITGLPRLTSYFNSYTRITDRTPALLATMDSLERITFDTCHGLTDVGVATLARLPALRELRVSGNGVTDAVRTMFPSTVAVNQDT